MRLKYLLKAWLGATQKIAGQAHNLQTQAFHKFRQPDADETACIFALERLMGSAKSPSQALPPGASDDPDLYCQRLTGAFEYSVRAAETAPWQGSSRTSLLRRMQILRAPGLNAAYVMGRNGGAALISYTAGDKHLLQKCLAALTIPATSPVPA